MGGTSEYGRRLLGDVRPIRAWGSDKRRRARGPEWNWPHGENCQDGLVSEGLQDSVGNRYAPIRSRE